MAGLCLVVLLSLLTVFTESGPADSTCDLFVTPTAATVKVGNDVTFICNATCLGGLSRDQLVWLNGQMQQVSSKGAERVQAVSYNRWSVSRLLVQRAQVSDSGVYTCEVQQGRRLLQFFIKLNVQDDSPAVLEDRGPTRGDIRARPEIFFPPVRPARAARDQRYGEAAAASDVFLDLGEAEKDDAVEKLNRSWRRKRQAGGSLSHIGTSASTPPPASSSTPSQSPASSFSTDAASTSSFAGANTTDATASASSTSLDTAVFNSRASGVDSVQDNTTSAFAPAPSAENVTDLGNATSASMWQNTGSSDSSPDPSSSESYAGAGNVSATPTSAFAPAPSAENVTDLGNATSASIWQNTGSSDSSPDPSSSESYAGAGNVSAIPIIFDDFADNSTVNPARSSDTTQANASEIVSHSSPVVPSTPPATAGSVTDSWQAGSTTTQASTVALPPSTTTEASTTPTTTASSSTTTPSSADNAGKGGEDPDADASSGSGEESDFGRYGLLAFGLTLGIALLLLYALLLVILVPRYCKKKGRHIFNSDVKAEGGSRGDKNDVILLGERPHKPRAPLTSATGLNGEFFTAVDLEDDGKDHGKKDRPAEKDKGTRKDEESDEGKGEKDEKKNKPDTFVSTFMVGRLSQSNQGSSSSQPNSPTTADVTSGKPPNLAAASQPLHEVPAAAGDDVMITSTPAVSDDDDVTGGGRQAGKGEPEAHDAGSSSDEDEEAMLNQSSSPSSTSSDKEMPPDRQPHGLGGGENFSLMPDIQFTFAAPVKPTDV